MIWKFYHSQYINKAIKIDYFVYSIINTKISKVKVNAETGRFAYNKSRGQ